jgi:hypothetical protein
MIAIIDTAVNILLFIYNEDIPEEMTCEEYREAKVNGKS